MREDTQLDLTARVVRALRLAQASVADDAREPASPDELAAAAHLSKFHFSRLFGAMTGESPAAHVRRLRLERAAGELARGDDQIVRIALRAGYEAHEPFSRAFKKHFGETPSEYRTQQSGHHMLGFPPAPSGVHFGPDHAVDRFTPITHPEQKMIDVEIKDIPARRLAAMRHTGPYHQVGRLFEQLFQWAGSTGMLMGPVEVVGVYYDDPECTPPEKLRAAAGFTCGPNFDGAPDVGVEILELQGGAHAVGTFKGHYSGLPPAYQWMFGEWMPKSGRVPADAPCYEVYLNSPQDTKPEDLLTAIHVPLA